MLVTRMLFFSIMHDAGLIIVRNDINKRQDVKKVLQQTLKFINVVVKSFVCLLQNTLENPYSEDYSVILREELHSVGQHFSSLAAYSVWTTGYVRRLYAAGG